MKYIDISEANQNLILEEDIFDNNGMLLINKGTTLTNETIKKIKLANINIIAISEKDDTVSEKDDPVSETSVLPEEENTKSDDDSLTLPDYKIDELMKELIDLTKNMNFLGKDQYSPIKSTALQALSEVLIEEEALTLLYKLSTIDKYTINHSVGVALLSSLISHWDGGTTERIKKAFISGLFSQVGKLGIPRSILLKKGALTDEELKTIKSYTLYSKQFLKNLSFIDEEIELAILQSTEKLNGTGLPKGLKGSEISYLAQIVGVANIFDAAMKNKCYKEAVSPFIIANELFEDSLEHLSPKATLPLIKAIQSSYLGMKVELSNGEIGEVVFMNKLDPSRPLVKVGDKIYDLSMGGEKLSIKNMIN